VTALQPTDPGRILAWARSMSFVAALPKDERGPFLEEVRALVESGDTPEELTVHFVVGMTNRER
jgi:hypothetical protein